MEVVVGDDACGIDYNRPGSSAGTVVFHGGRDVMVLRIAGVMGHGDFQPPFQLVFAQFLTGINFIAFEHGLDGYKFYPVIICIGSGQFLKGWEPRPAATGSPVLKEIQVNHHPPVIL